MLWFTVRKLKARDWGDRLTAVRALGESKDEAAIKPLLEVLLSDANESVRQEAARVLGDFQNVRSIDGLAMALRDANVGVRTRATEALGKTGDSRATDLVVTALEDREREVRMAAAIALERLKWRASESRLRASYLVERQKYSEAATEGASAIAPLVLALKDCENEGVDAKVAIAKALGDIGDVRAVEPLIHLLRSGNYTLKKASLAAAAKLGRDAIPHLLEILKDRLRPWDDRLNAITAIASIGGSSAYATLLDVLDPAWWLYYSDDSGKNAWMGWDRCLKPLRGVPESSVTDGLLNRLAKTEDDHFHRMLEETLASRGEKRILAPLLNRIRTAQQNKDDPYVDGNVLWQLVQKCRASLTTEELMAICELPNVLRAPKPLEDECRVEAMFSDARQEAATELKRRGIPVPNEPASVIIDR